MITSSLKRDGLYINISKCSVEMKKILVQYARKSSSLKIQLYNKRIKVRNDFIFTSSYLIIPRFTCSILIDCGIINVSDFWYDDIRYDANNRVEYTGKLRNNQQLMLNHIMFNVYNNTKYNNRIMNGCIVVMPTGTGKSDLASGLIDKLRVKTLIVVPTKMLANEWEKHIRIRHAYAAVGMFHSTKKIDGDIVIIICKSIISPKNKDNVTFFNQFGLIIWDEIHLYCNTEYSKAFKIATAPNILGLTATPSDRRDKMDIINKWYTGNIIHWQDVEGFTDEKASFDISVIKVEYYGSDDYTRRIGSNALEITRNYVNQLIADPLRNAYISSITLSLWQQNKNILVFTERRSHAIILAQLISSFNCLVSSPDIFIYFKKLFATCINDMPDDIINIILSYGYNIDPFIMMGGAKNDEVNTAKKSCPVMIVTYKYASVGFSCDRMDTIIYATPRRSNHTQVIGRILRVTSETRSRLVVDLVDMKTSLKSQYIDRQRIYNDNNSNISIIKYQQTS